MLQQCSWPRPRDFDGETAERYGYVNRALLDADLDLVAKKLGAGEITLTEAQDFSLIIELRRKVIETHEYGKRLQDLEEGRFKRDE